jgi:hypothetical protein
MARKLVAVPAGYVRVALAWAALILIQKGPAFKPRYNRYLDFARRAFLLARPNPTKPIPIKHADPGSGVVDESGATSRKVCT